MQVARLLEEGGTGRWAPKLRQARLALALERRLSKAEILNLYLALAPYGGNLEGVRAASLAYFGKEPRRLTAAQSALLIALPQSPETRRPDRAWDNAMQARSRVLDRLQRDGVLPVDEALAANTEALPEGRKVFPALAPHLADRVVSENPARHRHRLTIDGALQDILERFARHHVEGLGGGLSAAIVVMDYNSGQILASVGSAGYLDTEMQGFNDMTRAVRSPGSTAGRLERICGHGCSPFCATCTSTRCAGRVGHRLCPSPTTMAPWGPCRPARRRTCPSENSARS